MNSARENARVEIRTPPLGATRHSDRNLHIVALKKYFVERWLENQSVNYLQSTWLRLSASSFPWSVNPVIIRTVGKLDPEPNFHG